MSYDWSKFKGSSEEPSEERSEKHDKVCTCWQLCFVQHYADCMTVSIRPAPR